MAGHVTGRLSFVNSTHLPVIHEFRTITNFSGVFRPWPFDTQNTQDGLIYTIAPTSNSHTHSILWLSAWLDKWCTICRRSFVNRNKLPAFSAARWRNRGGGWKVRRLVLLIYKNYTPTVAGKLIKIDWRDVCVCALCAFFNWVLGKWKGSLNLAHSTKMLWL